MNETETVTDEPTALDKAQAVIPGASLMPGTDGAALIVPTEAVVALADRVTALNAQTTELRQEAFQARRALGNRDDEQQKALKEAVNDGTIDMDTAKTLAENLGLDPDALVTTYEVTVTVTVRVTGVEAEDEDEAGNLVSEAINADLSSYGLTYDSLDQGDVTVDSVSVED